MRRGLLLLALSAAAGWLLPAGAAADPVTPAPLPGLHREIPAAAKAYVQTKQFTSPLTHDGLSADVMTANAPAASYDYDFCPHPTFNTFAYALVTDPATGWTAYPDQFAYCPFTAEQLKQILGAPKFNRTPPPGLPWLDCYPWEQFENLALLSVAAKHSPLETGNLYMEAAWAVRLDVISGNNDFDAEVAALFKGLPQQPANPGDVFTIYELQLAHHWEQDRTHGVLKDVDATRFALAMAWLYRSRGELAACDHWLDQGGTGAAQQGGLPSFLRSSAKLERTYLKAAQAQFSSAWDAGGIDARRQGLTAYALGEISRRLGDLPAARSWYAEAERTNYGALQLDKLKFIEQFAAGRGY